MTTLQKPMRWWRYREDIFDIWTQGLPKLLEFTVCILLPNSNWFTLTVI